MNNAEVYAAITEKIIANLETSGSWQKFWDLPSPVSLNGHFYRGINYLILSNDQFKSRVERDPEFRAALFDEAIGAFLEGDTAVGKALLRDLVNSTIGFERLAEELDKSSKSIHRMLAPSGNPRMENLFQVIHAITKNEGISFKLTSSYTKGNQRVPA